MESLAAWAARDIRGLEHDGKQDLVLGIVVEPEAAAEAIRDTDVEGPGSYGHCAAQASHWYSLLHPSNGHQVCGDGHVSSGKFTLSCAWGDPSRIIPCQKRPVGVHNHVSPGNHWIASVVVSSGLQWLWTALRAEP